MPLTLQQFISTHQARLAHLSASPARLLRQLVAFRLGTQETQLLTYPEQILDPELLTALEADLSAIDQGRPLAHLFGTVPFLDWTFRSDSRALIPRPETEALVAQILELCRHQPPTMVLDLCCGSGVMGLSLALSFPEAQVHLSDLCPDALALCRENVTLLEVGSRANLFQGDLWAALPSDTTYDLIVANPPYVAEDEPIEASVLAYEPHLALYSDDFGLAHIKRILTELRTRLRPGGLAAFELGHAQQALLEPFLAELGKSGTWKFKEDPFGVFRYLIYSE